MTVFNSPQLMIRLKQELIEAVDEFKARKTLNSIFNTTNSLLMFRELGTPKQIREAESIVRSADGLMLLVREKEQVKDNALLMGVPS